jgi:hypothetical protein
MGRGMARKRVGRVVFIYRQAEKQGERDAVIVMIIVRGGAA